MATLQKFKLLATQCVVVGSPSRSPTASPVIHLRRRKTLRMLLGGGGRRLPPRREKGHSPDRKCEDEDMMVVSHKLKDLFVSSPPSFEGRRGAENVGDRAFRETGVGNCGGGRQLRLSATFRQRLLRRAWRPALVAIPED